MCRLFFYSIVVLIVLKSGTQYLTAQTLINDFTRLSTAEGLSSNTFEKPVYTDSKGLAWISTAIGLNRYDGYRVRSYHVEPGSNNSLRSETAANSRIYEDSRTNLWFCNNVSLARYNRATDDFSHFTFIDGFGDTLRSAYRWMYLDTISGVAYVGANNDIYGLNVNNPKKTCFVDSLYAGVDDLMLPLDDLGVNTEYVLIRNFLGGNTLEFRFFRRFMESRSSFHCNSPNGTSVNAMLAGTKGEYFVGTDQGVYLLDAANCEWSVLGEGKGPKEIRYLDQIDGNLILVTTKRSGIWLYDLMADRFTRRIYKHSFNQFNVFEPEVEVVSFDRNGILWISTVDEGLFFTDLFQPEIPTERIGSKENFQSVIDLITDRRDSCIWYLKPTEVVKIDKKDTIVFPLPVSGKGLGQTVKLFQDNRNRVWVATLTDLYVLEPDGIEFKDKHYLPSYMYQRPPGYNDIAQLPDGRLLFATNRYPVLQVNNDLTDNDWFFSGAERTRHIEVSKAGNILLSTFTDSLILGRVSSTGSFIIDTSFIAPSNVSSAKWNARANAFVLTTYAGIYYLSLQGHNWKLEPDHKVPAGTVVNAAVYSTDSTLFYTTPGAIVILNEKTGVTRKLSRRHGVQGNDFQDGAILATKSGVIRVGGQNGVNVIYPTTERFKKKTPTEIVVRSLSNGTVVYTIDAVLERPIVFKYETNDVSILFGTSDHSHPVATEFQYRLSGPFGTYQKELRNVPEIDLPNLREGEYELTLKGNDSDGVSMKKLSIPITILPPLYRTWWAYTIYALTIFGIAFTMFWLRLMRIRDKEKEQLKTARYKTQAAEAQAQAAKTETSVLRLQMNPHFIFNSLNAVNAFLWKGNKLEANEYLARFALLMRETLNRSTQTLSRLEDTIHSLENYLGTEQMRLGDRMSYKFEVDETLDTFSVHFPTMMLQPFVENAIWHGISGLEGQGLITIRFRPDQGRGVLIAEVEDNGQGRQQAAKRNTGHASKSLGITQRRLDLLNMALNTASETSTAPARRRLENEEEDNPKIGVSSNPIADMKIIDLLQADGSADGTLVRLTLPLKYPTTYASDNS